jgi:SAM-dependent methyltransferase
VSESGPAYDAIGRTYRTTRAPDPRIAAAIDSALGDARSVLNVGAGTGSYEPRDREVTALEPSHVMIAQRPPGSAPVLHGVAEHIPLEDDSVDAAMAILSDHHWHDRPAGIREMARVARRRVVLVNFDPALAGEFWMNRDYLPGFLTLVPEPYRRPGYFEEELRGMLDAVRLTALPIPHDCRDGFYYAYWRQPRAYLDSGVRENISVFHLLPGDEVDSGLARLESDLASGTWERRNADLLGRRELDAGLRVIVAETS